MSKTVLFSSRVNAGKNRNSTNASVPRKRTLWLWRNALVWTVSGLFAPRYLERKFPVGTFAPRSESSWEL